MFLIISYNLKQFQIVFIETRFLNFLEFLNKNLSNNVFQQLNLVFNVIVPNDITVNKKFETSDRVRHINIHFLMIKMPV